MRAATRMALVMMLVGWSGAGAAEHPNLLVILADYLC